MLHVCCQERHFRTPAAHSVNATGRPSVYLCLHPPPFPHAHTVTHTCKASMHAHTYSHMHTKWTPRSLLVHSTVDHNKSAGFSQSCCKSCIGLFLLCCVTGSFTCVQFHNHMFVFMTQQCVLWAIITVACKIGAHIIPWHMLCQNSRTRDLAVCERMKIWVL